MCKSNQCALCTLNLYSDVCQLYLNWKKIVYRKWNFRISEKYMQRRKRTGTRGQLERLKTIQLVFISLMECILRRKDTLSLEHETTVCGRNHGDNSES